MKPNKKTKDAIKEARTMSKESEFSDMMNTMLNNVNSNFDNKTKKIKERKPTGKMDRETFIIIMNLIIEQDDMANKFDDALCMINASWTICDLDEFTRKAIWKMLEIFYDDYMLDDIQWFLYEDVEKIITWDSGKKTEKKYHLKTVGDLYDYLEDYKRRKK